MLETNENVIINVIVQFILCIISFFLDILSVHFMNSLNRNPRIYTVPLIIPAEIIIKKKKKKNRGAREYQAPLPFGTHGFRGDVRAILFPRKGIWQNTVTPIFHEITVRTQASSHNLRCLSNRSRMHGLIRKNASFLNHITFRYIYTLENTLIILSQEVSLNYHNFFPSHPLSS